MQITKILIGSGLVTSVLGALEGGSKMGTSVGHEYGHGEPNVTIVGSTTTGVASSMVTDLTTVVQVTLSSEVVETLPETAVKSEDKSTSTVVTAISTSLVGTTLSSKSLASTNEAVLSTETNEAVGGTTTSSSSSSSDVTVRITSTVTLSGGAATVIRTFVQTTTQTEDFDLPTTTDTASLLIPTVTYSSGKMNWSTFDWTAITINTNIIFPSKTVLITSSDEAETSTSTVTDVDYTSTSTATVVVTGRARITTLTITIGYTSSYTRTMSTMTVPACTPSTRYITVGPGHPSFPVVQTKPAQSGSLTTVSVSPSKTANASTATTATTATTDLNSGVAGTGAPGYFKGNGTVNGTSTRGTSASMAQPTQTFTGDAVNVLNHNPEVLYATAALIAAIVGWVLK